MIGMCKLYNKGLEHLIIMMEELSESFFVAIGNPDEENLFIIYVVRTKQSVKRYEAKNN